MMNTLCLSCKNWDSDKCRTCLSVLFTKSRRKPQDIDFTNYKEMPITCKEYKRRTGKNWTGNNLVYVKIIGNIYSKEEIDSKDWSVMDCETARFEGYPMVCVLTQKRPPKKWLPKEYVLGESDFH